MDAKGSFFRVPRRSLAAWERVKERLGSNLRASGMDPKPADIYAAAVGVHGCRRGRIGVASNRNSTQRRNGDPAPLV